MIIEPIVMKRNILTIFLASPSDLEEERKMVRNIVHRVNKVLSRRVEWHIELLGWEDTLPGFSRPQALINKDVDACDLFIGMLWRRWGQATGKYSSGFEEEFIRAQDRRRKSSSPEIWLFFKTIDEENAKDPGEQLKKVLAFKEDQVQSKELLFKEFADSDSYQTVIHDDLLAYVLDLSRKQSEIESQEESLLAGHAREARPDVESKLEEASVRYPADLITLFSKIDTKLKEGKTSELKMSDRTRLYLQASAWFSERQYSIVVGNHEINLIYMYRTEWKLSDSERWLLLRSLIAEHNNRPGWYWFKEWEENQIDYWLTWIADNDSNDDVRSAALSLLADVGFKVNRELLEKGLTQANKRILLETIRLLRNTESVDNLDLLLPLINNEDADIKEKAISAQIEIMYLDNPTKGFLGLIESGARVPLLIEKTVGDMTLSVDPKLLFEALNKAEASMRRFCARYLRKSKLLTKDNCRELLKDTDARVRKEGLLELIEIGEDVDMDFIAKLFPKPKHGRGLGIFPEVSPNDFVVPLLKRSDPQDLLLQLDFFDLNANEAYRILAEDHFAFIASRIRSDLDDEFDTLRKDSETRLKAKYGAVDGVYKPETIEYMKDTFIASAIDGLAKNGQPEDVKYARKYLGNTKYNMADRGAISLLSKFGNSSDVDNLIQVSRKLYGETKEFALETAWRLSESKDVLLETLMNDNDDATSEIAVKILSKHDSSSRIEMAKTLFSSTKDNRRLQGLAMVSLYCNSDELETLLNDYVSQPTYYYNIVTWLDRCLYSNGRYLNFYKSNLFNMIGR